MSARYDAARRDFERLELIRQLDDQVELDSDRLSLMQNPTKAHAARMYEAGIRLWFLENPVADWDGWIGAADEAAAKTIAARYGASE